MIDLIAKLISGDGLTSVLVGVAVYLASLWVLFSFWVYLDAKKRYGKTYIAALFFVVVLIFSFPALVFYLITRPEDENDYIIFPSENVSNKGVNVPIVNFIGKDGKVNLSFELKINNPEFLNNSDMAVNIDWKSQKPEFVHEVKPVDVVVETPKAEEKSNKKDKRNKNNKRNERQQKPEVKSVVMTNKQKAFGAIKNVQKRVSGLKPRFSLPSKKASSKTTK